MDFDISKLTYAELKALLTKISNRMENLRTKDFEERAKAIINDIVSLARDYPGSCICCADPMLECGDFLSDDIRYFSIDP